MAVLVQVKKEVNKFLTGWCQSSVSLLSTPLMRSLWTVSTRSTEAHGDQHGSDGIGTATENPAPGLGGPCQREDLIPSSTTEVHKIVGSPADPDEVVLR
ncbi:hypothetical protein E2C01_054243 [Portunus trituberculatus]|uniref:Uncharacterized protein n=1 Tax=Portunus trituberculatus TaxID=210409 RepID=A0A5B7GUH1_PORTR|nr:hypothetical protein [Portunus trituberculatus]